MGTSKKIVLAMVLTLMFGVFIGFTVPNGSTQPFDFDSCAKLPDSVLLDDKTNCLTSYGKIFEKPSTPSHSSPSPSNIVKQTVTIGVTQPSSPTASIIPTNTSIPTPTPIRQDLFLYQPKHSMTRSYNDGSGKGTIVDSVIEGAPVATFTQYNKFWQSWVKTCFDFGIKEGTNQRIDYAWTTDGTTTIANGTYSGFENLAAGNNFLICNDTPTTPGTHTIHIALNSKRTIAETSFDNNSALLTYTIAADTISPTFDFYGPFKESEGTCLYPLNASDNLTVYSSLKIDVRMDEAPWQQFNGMRSCISGQAGESHTYHVKVQDEAGNSTEKAKQFTIL